jgi:hypothetical protein
MQTIGVLLREHGGDRGGIVKVAWQRMLNKESIYCVVLVKALHCLLEVDLSGTCRQSLMSCGDPQRGAGLVLLAHIAFASCVVPNQNGAQAWRPAAPGQCIDVTAKRLKDGIRHGLAV